MTATCIITNCRRCAPASEPFCSLHRDQDVAAARPLPVPAVEIAALTPAAPETPATVALLREALEAVKTAMLQGGDGAVGDFGWSITKLNKARPLIRAALAATQGAE